MEDAIPNVRTAFFEAASSPSWLEHCFHRYCIPGELVRTHLSAHVSRPPHCQISLANRDISPACLQEDVPSLSDVDLCVGPSDSQHSDVTVRLFESDTRVSERAR